MAGNTVQMDAALAGLDAAEREYDAAMGDLVGSLVVSTSEAETGYDKALYGFARKDLDNLAKGERKADKAFTQLSDSLTADLTDAELKRDAILREAGGNPTLILGTIFDAIQNGTLEQLADETMTLPMVQAAIVDELGPLPGTVPFLELPTLPPPPAETPTLLPGDVPTIPPPPSEPVEPGQLPYDPPECPSPGSRGYGPGVYVAVSPGAVPNGAVVLLTDPSGCTYYRFPTRPPPPPPPVKVPPSVPPVSSCDPPATAFVGCTTIPYPWTSDYWYVTSCEPGCATKICTYFGPYPPTLQPGEYLHGPFSAAATPEQLRDFARVDCRNRGTQPPPESPPPTAPPTVPGPPVGQQPPAGQQPPPGDKKPPEPGRVVPGVPNARDLEATCLNMATWLKAANGGELGNAGTIWSGAFANYITNDFTTPILGTVVEAIATVGAGIFGSLNNVLEAMGIENATGAAVATAPLALLGWMERITGAPFGYYGTAWVQTMHYASPLILPDQGSANTQYLSGVISDSQWECLTKLNGVRPGPERMTVEASRARLGIQDSIALYRRGKIDRPTLNTKMRNQGVLHDAEREEFLQVTEAIPTPGDIIRMMVRDVEDEKVWKPNEYDKFFEDKYTGQLEQWGIANAMSKQQMLYLWRAHWELPSNTTVYESIRRLRPGRVQPLQGIDQQGNPVQVPVKPVTLDDAAQVLLANDVAPGWVGRTLALSYVPVNLTEIKALHKNGVIDREEVYQRLQDIGKSPADAATLTDLVVRDNARMFANEAGALSRRRTVREYVDGGLTRLQARTILAVTIPDEDVVTRVLDEGDMIRGAEARRECIKGLKRRYMVGEFDDPDAKKRLEDLGVDDFVATTMVAKWHCTRDARAREPRVTMLQSWWNLGIIDSNELYTRLKRLGFSFQDASRIVTETETARQLRNQKEAAALAERQRKEAKADARYAKAQARQRYLDAAKAAKQGGNPPP